jgi:hypothetical protein
MAFQLFDYCALSGENEFKAWSQRLQKPERAKLNAKLDKLKNNGDELFPLLLTGTDTPGILKLRVKGKVQLRPMLCKGPIEIDNEYTLLLGAFEVGGNLRPDGADRLANDLKAAVIASPATRRIIHERVG